MNKSSMVILKSFFKTKEGATTLSITTLSITTLSIMTFGIGIDEL
jgi:hypothetical protein